ncbi:MAG: hypothetical protein Salg2KO_21910 [Salibacteraceae bacterium]
MNRFILLVIIVLCAETIVAQNRWETTLFTVYSGKSIAYDSEKMKRKSYRLEDGNKLVFEHQHNKVDEGNQSNANEIVVFQIPIESVKFSYKNEELLEVDAIYVQNCRCQDRGVHQIDKGFIKGKRNKRGEWKIELEVEVNGNRTGKKYRFNLSDEFELN